MTTITASTTIGFDLNPAYVTSPVVIGTGVRVSNSNYPSAVYYDPAAPAAFTIANYGTVAGSTNGIYLGAGGMVSNASGGRITGAYAIRITGGAGTVVNDGTISGTPQRGVLVTDDGVVVNAASAAISGGVSIDNRQTLPTGTVANYGTIAGGVYLDAGLLVNGAAALVTGYTSAVEIGSAGYGAATGTTATVVNYGNLFADSASFNGYAGAGVLVFGAYLALTNASSGSISGLLDGVKVEEQVAGSGSVVNFGTIVGLKSVGVSLPGASQVTNGTGGQIVGAADGVYLGPGGLNPGPAQPGILTNSGTIVGAVGVDLAGSGTLTNGGAIVGTGGTAVSFGGTAGSRLVVDPGASFAGLVVASSSASNMIELAPGNSVGTLSGLGTQFLHFTSIVFDAGAAWSVSGPPRGLSGTISGFARGDTIDLVGISANSYAYAGQHMTLFNDGIQVGQLDLSAVNAVDGFAVVPDGNGGTDITVSPASPRDFDGNGTADILWRDTGGNVAIWEMNGFSVAASAVVGFADPVSWTIQGTGDFAGDGKADILWQDASGDVAIWDMNGFSLVASGLAGFADPASWNIAATGDFDGNGTSDILWQDTAGNVNIWEMNGTTVAGSAIVGFADPTAWHIRGTGDFNGDGKSDILWQNISGNVDIWEMNGLGVAASAVVGFADPVSGHIEGTGDFNGDGKSDILWQDTSGDVAIWEMNGFSVAASAVVGFADPSTWHIAGIGDYNGDGKSDILWQSTSGNVNVWEMNGLSVATSGLVGFADPAAWTIVPPDNTGDTIAAPAAAAAVSSAPPIPLAAGPPPPTGPPLHAIG
jgi:hypothetical protein